MNQGTAYYLKIDQSNSFDSTGEPEKPSRRSLIFKIDSSSEENTPENSQFISPIPVRPASPSFDDAFQLPIGKKRRASFHLLGQLDTETATVANPSISLNVTPTRSPTLRRTRRIHSSAMSTPALKRVEVRVTNNKDQETRKSYGFLSSEEIEKKPIPKIVRYDGKTVLDWARFPRGWTVTKSLNKWTETIPFETSWGIVGDPRLYYAPTEENEILPLEEPIYTYCFFHTKAKKEASDWDLGITPDPPFQQVYGYWGEIPTANEYIKKTKHKVGDMVINPYNRTLKEWNSTKDLYNQFNVLLEQSFMYFDIKDYKYNWRKAIMDDEQELFASYELELIYQACNPTIEGIVTSNGIVTEILVKEQTKVGPDVFVKRMEKIREYLIDRGYQSSKDLYKTIKPPPESNDPRMQWEESIFHYLLWRLNIEEALKILTKALRYSAMYDTDQDNMWNRRMKQPISAFNPLLKKDQENQAKTKGWQAMKDQLRAGIHKRATSPEPRNVPSPVTPTDPDASLHAPDPGSGQRRRRPPSPTGSGGGIIPPIRGGGDPDDSSDPSSDEGGRGRGPRRNRRGTTPIEANEWLFPPPPDPPGGDA